MRDSPKSTAERLIQYISTEFIIEEGVQVDSDTKLISSGLIDSFSLVTLQSFIEKNFGAKIPAPRMTAEYFDTVKEMIELIKQFSSC